MGLVALGTADPHAFHSGSHELHASSRVEAEYLQRARQSHAAVLEDFNHPENSLQNQQAILLYSPYPNSASGARLNNGVSAVRGGVAGSSSSGVLHIEKPS